MHLTGSTFILYYYNTYHHLDLHQVALSSLTEMRREAMWSELRGDERERPKPRVNEGLCESLTTTVFVSFFPQCTLDAWRGRTLQRELHAQ